MFNKIKKNRKAFTLIELIIYMVLIGLVLYPMASMLNFSMQNLKENDQNFQPMLYALIEDIKYDNTISNSITFNPISDQDTQISFNRLDGCNIVYRYDNTQNTLSRSVNGCTISSTSSVRSYTISNIDTFNLRLNNTTNASYNAFDNLGNYEMRLTSSLDAKSGGGHIFNYRYVLYKK